MHIFTNPVTYSNIYSLILGCNIVSFAPLHAIYTNFAQDSLQTAQTCMMVVRSSHQIAIRTSPYK